jgi:hypothetical protein
MRTGCFAIALFSVATFGSAASSGVCDFRLSELIGSRSTALTEVAAGTVVAGGLGMKAAGFYTLVHATSGLTMLGSTLPGISAAGTVGIIAGTGGVIGSASAVLMNPITGIAAGAVALGVGGLEGACYFQDERIDDYYEVLSVMTAVAESASPDYFQLQLGASRKKAAVVEIWDPELQIRVQHRVADLYFVNGALVEDTIGPFNTTLCYLLEFEGDKPRFSERPDN